ncbi:hypothetical protein Dsin_014240 [Dipteronia sinensis]|uniref:Apple domain-containing protein n=1 Tax=Dipteronia sinensis TaxID=43782 RepID=A0AAE0EBD9_9ROSI|nr:hypothetical protein Dsin_014240 [Dipteronia sinensis]
MLQSDPETFEITLVYFVANSAPARLLLGKPKHNSTLSMLRLEIDGNLKLYTYNDKADGHAWEVTFNVFSRDSDWANECQLPEKCGEFGVCDNNLCVACPSEEGELLEWSKECEARKVNSCDVKDFHFYKLEGVDHFMSKYNSGSGVMKVDKCGKKCSRDCKCLGYFYHKETSKCWIAYDLMTLSKFPNSTHLGYIKVPNKKLIQTSS